MFLAPAKSRHQLKGFEKCVEMDARPPLFVCPAAVTDFDEEQYVKVLEATPFTVSHSCWGLGGGRATMWQHSHGPLSPATHVLMLQKLPTITVCFGSNLI